MSMTKTQRVARARKAALAMHAKHDSSEVSEKARAAFRAKFTTEQEFSDYMRSLAAKSVSARQGAA